MQLAAQVEFYNLTPAVFSSGNNEQKPTQCRGSITEAKRKEESYGHVLLLQDVFSEPENSYDSHQKTPKDLN